ncbi:uncharacterized protein LOC128862111 isoform X2 [Anastrepha ludens]|uniref:uncharacterized protein LOC128862111 isoform X2 n=1 Tax=Anastrepha ludens TaxID=28586 RepID=UPI0023AED50C|nr:uncharacterized protein LOC128862111 isoform X2 [Anastrepha ludens]
MGKCVSKHPSVLTIALSEKDLATANQIWSKFAESTEYIALKDEHGNQLCEYYYVNGKKQKQQQKQQQKVKTKSKSKAAKEALESTDEDNYANATIDDATKSAKQNQNSNENQIQQQSPNPNAKQQQQQSQQKGRNKKRSKSEIVHTHKSTQESTEHKSNQRITSNAATKSVTTITNGAESHAKKLRQNCATSLEVTNVVDDATATTDLVYANVSGCEYCTVVSTTDDDDDDDDDEVEEYDESIENEAVIGVRHHYGLAAHAAVIDSIHTNIATFDAYKNQQHQNCLAHLLLQPEEQNVGDMIVADGNNNVRRSQTNHEEYHFKQQQRQQQLLAKDQAQLINGEVCKVNIGVKNVAAVDESSEVSERISSNDYLVVVSDDATKGQAESKKHMKKHGGSTTGTTGTGMGIIETKGTAMSFGFRKKLNTTPKKLKKLLEASVGGVTGGDARKKQDKCNNITTTTSRDGNSSGEDNEKAGTQQDDGGNGQALLGEEHQDDNGNAELLSKVHFEKMGAAAATTQRSNQSTGPTGGGQATNLPGVASRFGYRGSNIARPASAGLAQRYQMDMQENAENNNNYGNIKRIVGDVDVNGQRKPLVSNLKRRSKSAHAGRALTSGDETSESGSGSDAAGRPKITQPKSITFNLSQNSTIEYQRRQFFEQPSTYGSYGSGRNSGSSWTHQPTYQSQQHQSRNVINTGMHTNVIVRPTPRAPPASFSKFTLHTVSLPKPEFPVAISVGVTTPTTPGGVYTPSPVMTSTMSGARAKEIQQQHPLTVVASASVTHTAGGQMDLKTAKQMANNTRRGFSGSREISADSGIASMDMALDSSVSSGGDGGSIAGRRASPKRSRSRPRNLQMVMNGRHKFQVRDLDDPLSSESSSIVEPLALPKLPNENQTVPLPLCGLVRSDTVLSRESYERNGGIFGNRSEAGTNQETKQIDVASAQCTITRNSSEESEGVDEEKLYLDRSTSEKGKRFKDINTCSSKTSSPGSSIMLSWCNAGESLAVKDCSSLSISSEDSNKLQEEGRKDKDKDTDTEKYDKQKVMKMSVDLNDDDISGIVTDMQASTLSSLTEILPNGTNLPSTTTHTTLLRINVDSSTLPESAEMDIPDRPKSFYNTLNETKFAEMALAGSTYLLDDETSPTDSLVSSTESEEAASKQKKHKINEELQEKDIDEISPELEMGSPISPGTPTHASHSLSLSDCGNLIDDEIADQPALLFNSEAHDLVDSLTSHKDKTDTPTLMENTGSLRSLKSLSKARTALQQAIELSLRTPLSLRKAVMERAESLDTLSPCESICSDDLMMDFDMQSSVDSLDRSVKSRSGSDLHKIGENELFSELDRKGSDVMKELNSILRLHTNRNSDKDSAIAHLPARATRLLNRSRLQQQQYPASSTSGLLANAGAGASGGGADSDSSKSTHSLRRSGNASRASNASTSSTNASQPLSSHYHHQKPFQHHYSQLYRDSHSSSDDLMLYDKSFRNAMIQDVLQFKKQLLRLRRILQENEEPLMRTDTLNPFDDDNGQLFAACGLDSKLLDDMDLTSLASSIADDPMVELADLRRQGEVEDRERTIRLQKNQIESLESKKPAVRSDSAKECINTATQTERTRPLSYGPEGLSRSKPEYTSYTTHYHPAASCDNNSLCSSATTSNNSLCTHHQQQKQQQHNCNGSNNNLPAAASEAASQQIRRHTIISTTLSNYNQQLPLAPRRASIAWEKPTATAPTTAATLTQTSAAGTAIHAPTANIYKPVKITLIGEPLKQWQWNAASNGKTTAAVQSNGTTSTISNDSVKGVKSETNGGGGDAGDGNWNGRNKSNGNSDGMCNGLTNGLSKEFKNGLCNGAADSYGSNGYSRTNGSSNNYKVKAIGGVGNGKQLGCGSVVDLHNSQQNQMIYQQQQNHHVHKPHIKQALLPPGQQQQQKTQLASRNSHQQQQKPLQVYQTPNGTNGTNANFNPTVTIV